MAKLQKPKPKVRLQQCDGRDLKPGCLFTRDGIEHEVEAITGVRTLEGRVDLVTTKGVAMTFTGKSPKVGLVKFIYSKPSSPHSEGPTTNQGNTMANKKPPAPPAKKKTAAPKAPKSPVNKDTKNGITRPKDGTTSAKIWALAEKHGERGPVIEGAAKLEINAATAATQFGKWRKYHGITGRAEKPVKQTKKATPAKTKATPPPPPAAE